MPENAAPVVIPVLPGMQDWRGGLPRGLCALALDPEFETGNGGASLPSGEFLSPVLLAVAVRGIYDLIAAAPERAQCPWPRINRALKESPWQRRGIYLSLAAPPDPETWAGLFRHFLDEGFLLPPGPADPLILPGELSPGEAVKLAGALQFRPQGAILNPWIQDR